MQLQASGRSVSNVHQGLNSAWLMPLRLFGATVIGLTLISPLRADDNRRPSAPPAQHSAPSPRQQGNARGPSQGNPHPGYQPQLNRQPQGTQPGPRPRLQPATPYPPGYAPGSDQRPNGGRSQNYPPTGPNPGPARGSQYPAPYGAQNGDRYGSQYGPPNTGQPRYPQGPGYAPAYGRQPATPPPAYPQGYGPSEPGRQGYNNQPNGAAPYPRTGNGAPNGPGQQHLGEWLQHNQTLSPQQKEHALQSEPGFNRLAPAQQQRLVQRLHDLDNMPASQRQRTLDRVENMERLSPQQREQVRGAANQLQSMPQERQRAVKRAFQDLRNVPPGLRDSELNSPRYAGQFNPQERSVLGNLLSVEPYEPAPLPQR